MYVQQGYVFGRVSLYVYMWTKKLAVWGLTTEKYLISVICYSLVKFNGKKGVYYARWFIQGKKFRTISINGMGEGFRKIVLQ